MPLSDEDFAQSLSAEWFLAEDPEDAATSLFVCAEQIRDDQAWMVEADRIHACQYGGARAEAAFLDGSEASDLAYEYTPAKLPRNVSRSAVDTYVTKIGKHRPLPEILAQKGNWRDQRRARKMTQLIEGEFDKHKIFKRWARVILRDSAVYGDGYLKIDLETPTSKTISTCRVLPRELWVDPADAEYGDPRNIYYMTTRDLGRVIATFAPDDEELSDKLRAAAKDDSRSDWMSSTSWTRSTVSRIRLVEAHHLCDDVQAHEELKGEELEAHVNSDACTGRHIIAARGVCLVDEKWPFPRFPYAKLPYLEPLEGWRSMGLCERLEGYAAEQNLASEKLSAGMYYEGGGIVYLSSQGDVVEEELTNSSNVRILRGPPGQEPKFFAPTMVNPNTLNYPRDLGVEGLNEEGLSSMSARSQKPAGANSGVALNTIDDIETERFGMQGYGYAQWCVDVAELYVMWIQYIAKEHGDYSSQVPLRGGVLELSWKDVAIDNYTIRAYPASQMAQQPAARRAKAEELFNAGRIDGAAYLRVIGAGEADIDAEVDNQIADRILFDEQIDVILDAPDAMRAYSETVLSPFTANLVDFDDQGKPEPGWCIRRAQQRVAHAMSAGCDEENLDAVRELINDMLEMAGLAEPTSAGEAMGTPAPMSPLAVDNGGLPPAMPPMAPPANTNGAPPGAPMMPPGAPPGMPPIAA